MKLSIFTSELVQDELKNYILSNQINSRHPIDVIAESKLDNTRFDVAIRDDDDTLIGFMCLHFNAGRDFYSITDDFFINLKAMSVDDRYQNRGIGREALKDILNFAQTSIDNRIEKVILGVNVKNNGAYKAYINAGFKKRDYTVDGPYGPLYVMEKSWSQFDDVVKFASNDLKFVAQSEKKW